MRDAEQPRIAEVGLFAVILVSFVVAFEIPKVENTPAGSERGTVPTLMV